MRFTAFGNTARRRNAQVSIEAADEAEAKVIAEAWAKVSGASNVTVAVDHAMLKLDADGRVLVTPSLDGDYEPLTEAGR